MLSQQEVTSVCWSLGGLITALLIVYFRRQLRIIWLMLRLPGPFAYPIIGNAYLAIDHKRLVKEASTAPVEYGPLLRAWITVFPMIFIFQPHDIQKVLACSKHVEKAYFYRMLHSFLGKGLITSESTRWREHRRLIQPALHVNVLEEYAEYFTLVAAHCVQLVQDRMRQSATMNIAPCINKCVLLILNGTILGTGFNSFDTRSIEKSPFRNGSVKLQYRWQRPWLMLNSIYKMTAGAKKELETMSSLMDFTRNLMKQRKTSKETLKNSFLSYLMKISEKNPDFTEDDCIQEACTFMLAGQDSVGAAIALCLHSLANNTDIQERVLEELDSIFGHTERPATSSDLRQMKYLEQCLKETLRLYPSVPIIARQLGEDVQLGDHVLPEGCEVVISPFSTHRLEDIYPDPEMFDPDRFSSCNVEKRHPFAYLPFSAGPRNCIGYKFAMLEMKAIVSTILRHFTLSPAPGKEKLNLKYRITLISSGGVWVTVRPRGEEERGEGVDERQL